MVRRPDTEQWHLSSFAEHYPSVFGVNAPCLLLSPYGPPHQFEKLKHRPDPSMLLPDGMMTWTDEQCLNILAMGRKVSKLFVRGSSLIPRPVIRNTTTLARPKSTTNAWSPSAPSTARLPSISCAPTWYSRPISLGAVVATPSPTLSVGFSCYAIRSHLDLTTSIVTPHSHRGGSWIVSDRNALSLGTATVTHCSSCRLF